MSIHIFKNHKHKHGKYRVHYRKTGEKPRTIRKFYKLQRKKETFPPKGNHTTSHDFSKKQWNKYSMYKENTAAHVEFSIQKNCTSKTKAK